MNVFLSYAPNAEDVVLARVFRDQPEGFWLDLGAGDPNESSVTRHLSEQGWRGINVTADAATLAALQAARPRDVSVSGPASPATLLAEHAPPGGVDLLRIAGVDAASAFAELDLGAFRPRVLLVTAVDESGAPNHHGWHRKLVAAGYRFALFDGMSRFYVTEAEAERLAPLLLAPANARDGWRPAQSRAPEPKAAEPAVPDAATTGRIAALEAEVAALREAGAEARRLQAELATAQAVAARHAARLDAAERGQRQLEAHLAEAQAEAERARAEIAEERARADQLAGELATARAKASGPLGWLTGGRAR